MRWDRVFFVVEPGHRIYLLFKQLATNPKMMVLVFDSDNFPVQLVDLSGSSS